MVAGHLREKNGYYHMVLNYVDEYGKRHTPSKSTGLTVKGNKKRAEKMLSEARAAKEAELEARAIKRSTGKAPVGTILFTAFLLDWLKMTKKNVEETTYGAYSMGIKSKIIPYFEEHHPGLALQDVTPKHIQDYYTYELTVRGVSANTVIHRHANIRKALQHAFKLGLIDSNPADRIERPKKEKFVGSFYEEDELNHLFEVVRGDPIELGVILGAFYGLRRSEAVGLKWDAIDFKKKTITIRHTVTQATIDGKSKIIQKDRTKTKASYRSLPPFWVGIKFYCVLFYLTLIVLTLYLNGIFHHHYSIIVLIADCTALYLPSFECAAKQVIKYAFPSFSYRTTML